MNKWGALDRQGEFAMTVQLCSACHRQCKRAFSLTWVIMLLIEFMRHRPWPWTCGECTSTWSSCASVFAGCSSAQIVPRGFALPRTWGRDLYHYLWFVFPFYLCSRVRFGSWSNHLTATHIAMWGL